MVLVDIDDNINNLNDFMNLSSKEKYLKIKLLYDILENSIYNDKLLSIETMVENNIEEKTLEYEEIIKDLQNDLNYEQKNIEKTIQKEIVFQSQIKDQEITFLQNKLEDKETIIKEKNDMLEHWGISKMNTSGNVVKGDIGEKILETYLKQNLSKCVKSECKVELVSKGKGHTGDLLIHIPILKKKILIESKYKDSEKVRTKEINRSKDDLITSEYDPDIILAVSFKTGFTGLEDRKIEMLEDSCKVKLYSVFENFEEHFKDGNAHLLCDWIFSLIKVHDNMKDSDISKLKCIENKIEDFRKINKLMSQHHSKILKDLKIVMEFDNDISKYINQIIRIIDTNKTDVIEIKEIDDEYSTMNKDKLKSICKEKGLKTIGTKNELVQRLNNKS